ncbi:MAG TPA: M20 family metallo-hydrolase [Emcibacteraceae bacterium]|nr:M20 family metallo-hydrolase [Emcibacteraceae bacterium]
MMVKSRFMGIAALVLLNLSAVSLMAAELPKASAERLEKRIIDLSQYGRNADGGVDRVAFSDANVEGHKFMVGLMKASGLEVSVDPAGNIIGKRPGKNPNLPPILFGSHIDSVPGGGNYDGDVGVMAALEVMDLLNSANIVTDHPLEMMVFTAEESSMIGSRSFTGDLSERTIKEFTTPGTMRTDGLDRLGGDHTKLQQAARKTPIHAFVELHIEQGGILESKKLNIGIVEGIVGISTWPITVEGFANHAGTTPMPGRRDALVAASKLIVAINDIATNMEGRQVATVGTIKAFPGASNVIPGRVEFSLQIRDLDAGKIQHLFEVIQQAAKPIEKEMDVTVSFGPSGTPSPALTDPAVRDIIEQSAKELGLSYQHMQSGAGHDAQHMAEITPTGMIFVPSRGGISHSPNEYSSPEDMANGANVLLHTILKLDQTKFAEE